jgi:DUF1680 family protein
MQRYAEPSLDRVRIDDRFWTKYQDLVRTVVLPYQWEALNDRVPGAEPSGAIRNFKVAAGLEEGGFTGLYFQDSDLAKWLEAVSYSLHTHPDPGLQRAAEETIGLIGRAQQPDGYLDTRFIVQERERRWTDLYECHELYVMGHMIEAGVAWHRATGRRDLLDVVCRAADCIDAAFGAEPGKIRGYDGHEEIELALAQLYEETGEERYLRLSRFFLEERGREPYFFTQEWERLGHISAWSGNPMEDPATNREYNQAHLPVKEQRVAVGHAVRQVYLLTGMADVAMKTGDEEMMAACRALWEDITTRQMYITGGIGATHHGEAFTFGHDLPNDTVYAETCATIGLIFFAQKMLEAECRREYADVIERALYNLVVGSMAADGMHYFYVNPLEVWREASEKDPGKRHVRPVRQSWFGCACCPPNLARLLASLGRYIYAVGEGTLFVHQYIGSEATLDMDGVAFGIRQASGYPWKGDIELDLSPGRDADCTLALRIPSWCIRAEIAVNGGAAAPVAAGEDGYARIRRTWRRGDTVRLSLDMPATLVEAHPRVRADAGKAAIQRGPIVYCLEEADNGANLSAISIPAGAALHAEWDACTLGGAWVVTAMGMRDDEGDWGRALYRAAAKARRPVGIKAVPYCLWGNRQSGEMAVWIREC